MKYDSPTVTIFHQHPGVAVEQSNGSVECRADQLLNCLSEVK
jgi:hypothetical protein